MGSSRRHKKKTRSASDRVRVGQASKKPPSAPDPVLLPSINKKVAYNARKTQKQNFEALGLVSDPTHRGGRQTDTTLAVHKPQVPGAPSEDEEEAARNVVTHDDDDELRALCNKERKSGKAEPKMLTSMQRVIMKKLVDKHGDDAHAMARDRKLNPMQHSPGVLRMMIVSYNAHESMVSAGRQNFRAPIKGLGKRGVAFS